MDIIGILWVAAISALAAFFTTMILNRPLISSPVPTEPSRRLEFPEGLSVAEIMAALGR